MENTPWRFRIDWTVAMFTESSLFRLVGSTSEGEVYRTQKGYYLAGEITSL